MNYIMRTCLLTKLILKFAGQIQNITASFNNKTTDDDECLFPDLVNHHL